MALQLKPIVPKTISFWIRGISPLIMHAWSEKAARELRMTAAERKKQPKVARDPETEATNAMYRLKDGSPAFPVLAFKASLISAAHKDLGIEKTVVRKSLFIPSQAYENMLAPLEASDPIIREDFVRVGNNSTDLRYRPEFAEWRAKIYLEILSDMLNEQDIVNLVNRAGFCVGICEWRPEKGGEFGRYELDVSEPMQEVNAEELQ